jgi:hypothetical protein
MEDVEDTGLAIWWPIDNEPRSQDTRKFQGEIHLAKTLKPTSAISHFTLKVSISRKENYLAHNWNQYFVIVMPFDATGFSSVDTRPLIRQEVNIATVFAKVQMPSQHRIFNSSFYQRVRGPGIMLPAPISRRPLVPIIPYDSICVRTSISHYCMTHWSANSNFWSWCS